MFCKALKMSKSLNNKSREADILSQIAYCYYHKGQYDIALKYIDKALAGVDSVSLRPVYSIAIRIFEKTGKRDSAIALSKKYMILMTSIRKATHANGLPIIMFSFVMQIKPCVM